MFNLWETLKSKWSNKTFSNITHKVSLHAYKILLSVTGSQHKFRFKIDVLERCGTEKFLSSLGDHRSQSLLRFIMRHKKKTEYRSREKGSRDWGEISRGFIHVAHLSMCHMWLPVASCGWQLQKHEGLKHGGLDSSQVWREALLKNPA